MGSANLSGMVLFSSVQPERSLEALGLWRGSWRSVDSVGWGGEAERRAAMAALRPLRRAGQVAVFRKVKSLRKRGLFEHVGS